MNMSVSRKCCFVSGCLALALRLARVVGIAPLAFVKEKTGWRIHFSPRWAIYGYSCTIFHVLLTASTLMFNEYRPQNKPLSTQYNIIGVMWYGQLLFFMCVAGTSAFGAPGRMRSLIACLNHLQKINSNLDTQPWLASKSGERKKIYLFIFWVIFSGGLGCIDIVQQIYSIFNNSTVSIIDIEISGKWSEEIFTLYCVGYFSLSRIVQTQMDLYIVLTLHVVCSFKAVNDSLKGVLHETIQIKSGVNKRHVFKPTTLKQRTEIKKCLNNSVDVISASECTHSAGTRPHHDIIRALALEYMATCTVVKEVDRCYGHLVLMMLLSVPLYLVVTLYDMVVYLLKLNEQLQDFWILLGPAVQHFSWIIYHTTNLLAIMEPSHTTHVEMELTRELVSQLLYCAPSAYEPLAVELQLFSRHLMLHQVSYSPMKVATLKRSLVVTIISSIIAYLVIIVQL